MSVHNLTKLTQNHQIGKILALPVNKKFTDGTVNKFYRFLRESFSPPLPRCESILFSRSQKRYNSLTLRKSDTSLGMVILGTLARIQQGRKEGLHPPRSVQMQLKYSAGLPFCWEVCYSSLWEFHGLGSGTIRLVGRRGPPTAVLGQQCCRRSG